MEKLENALELYEKMLNYVKRQLDGNAIATVERVELMKCAEQIIEGHSMLVMLATIMEFEQEAD